jgi:hypothetical protein
MIENKHRSKEPKARPRNRPRKMEMQSNEASSDQRRADRDRAEQARLAPDVIA